MLIRRITLSMDVTPSDDLRPPRAADKMFEINKVVATLRADLEKHLKFGEVIVGWGTVAADYK